MLIEKDGKKVKRNLKLRKSGLVSSISEDRSRLPLIISICFTALAAIGAFGTLAWVTGQLNIAQINPLFVPIAPLTIVLVVLLGASCFLYGVGPGIFPVSKIPVGFVSISL